MKVESEVYWTLRDFEEDRSQSFKLDLPTELVEYIMCSMCVIWRSFRKIRGIIPLDDVRVESSNRLIDEPEAIIGS